MAPTGSPTEAYRRLIVAADQLSDFRASERYRFRRLTNAELSPIRQLPFNGQGGHDPTPGQ